MTKEKCYRIKNGKKHKKLLVIFTGCLFFLGLLLLVPQVVEAGGLTEAFQSSQTGYLYSAYALDNYDLDFYVDSSWSWLPWNWVDAIGRQVMYGVYMLTNGLWYISRLLSSATGSVVSEAYRFDLINEVADSIGINMQHLAGVSASGFSGSGFYPGFIMLVIVALGVYVAYVGLFKREVSRALGAVIKTAVIFLMTTAIIVYAPTYIRYINEFSSDISTAALNLGTNMTMPGANQGTGDSVDLIRDNLFSIQVYQPWLLLQWGTTDVNAIGQERVNNLLAANPDAEYGATRENLVKEEIETYGNMRMTTLKVGARFGEAIFILFINLFISIFVIFLCGLMVFTQILFIIYVLFLVVSFVLSMFPECGGILKNALIKVFNVIMLRAGYTLLITIAFTISSMIYSISANHSFVIIGFLQIVTFAGIFFTKGDILQMMSLREDTGIRRAQAMGGLLAYSKLRRGAIKRERRMEKIKGRARENAGEIKDTVREKAGEKVNEMMDRRAANWQRERAAQRAERISRMRAERDYTVAGREQTLKTENMESVSFHRRDKETEATSQELYDRYFQYEKPKKTYQVSGETPKVDGAKFGSVAFDNAKKVHVRPELWAKKPDGESVKKTYYKRRFEDKSADAVTPDSVGAELKDEPRRYHVASADMMRKASPNVTRRQQAQAAQPKEPSQSGKNTERERPVNRTTQRTGRGTNCEHPDRWSEQKEKFVTRMEHESDNGTMMREETAALMATGMASGNEETSHAVKKNDKPYPKSLIASMSVGRKKLVVDEEIKRRRTLKSDGTKRSDDWYGPGGNGGKT